MSETLKFNTPVIDAEGNIKNLADLAGGGGIEPVLLWENPDATVEFAPTTLNNIEMDGLTHLIVLSHTSTTATQTYFDMTEIKENISDYDNARRYSIYLKANTNDPVLSDVQTRHAYIRTCKAGINDKQIIIGDCMRTATNVLANENFIPTAIYGIDLSSILS